MADPGGVPLGEWIALGSVVAAGFGVFAALRSEVAGLAASFSHIASAIDGMREDLHGLRREIRTDLADHAKTLDNHGQRIASIEGRLDR